MGMLQKRSFAVTAMILMIIVGTLVGSHNSLQDLRGKAELVFTVGRLGDGVGIQGDLRERNDAAYNMVVIARKYLPEDNPVIRNVLDARQMLDAAASIGEKASANKKLDTAVKDLFDVLNGMSLSEQDARYPQRLYTDFRARGDTISHDSYNQTAARFNETLSRFPAGILGSLTGIQPLEFFYGL